VTKDDLRAMLGTRFDDLVKAGVDDPALRDIARRPPRVRRLPYSARTASASRSTSAISL
jgi:hypothetical protein